MKARQAALLAVVATAAAEGPAAFAQAAPEAVEHVQVHEAPGQTRQQLCTAARDWAAMTFRDSKAVVEVFDAEGGRLIGKGRASVAFMATVAPVDFTLVVECRDGRARATFTGLTATISGHSFPVATSPSERFRANALAEMRRIDGLLGEHLKKPRAGGEW